MGLFFDGDRTTGARVLAQAKVESGSWELGAGSWEGAETKKGRRGALGTDLAAFREYAERARSIH
jgi:8-oxo-dGTP pyrophosphatase MutT (NUDIX family)